MPLVKTSQLTSRIKNSILEFTRKSKQFDEVKFYETLLVFSLIVFLISIVVFWPDNGFGENIRVEFVGFCFDVFLLGLIYAIFKKRNQRDEDIKRWQEEIHDYQGWDEKEATFRIIGNIKRLNRAKVTNIDLRYSFLNSAQLMDMQLDGSDLRCARLKGAYLNGAHLRGVKFSGADIEGADFYEAHLEGANLSGAHLRGAILGNAFLDGAIVGGPNSINWLDNLEELQVEGSEELLIKYRVILEGRYCIIRQKT